MLYESNLHTIQEMKDICHTVTAIKITMLHQVYLNMLTAWLLTNCSNTLRNIHTNVRENITRTHAEQKADYFFVAHSLEFHIKLSYNVWQVFNTTAKNYICVVIIVVICEFWPNDLHFDFAAPSKPDCEAATSTCQPNAAHWHTQWTCSVSFLCWNLYHKTVKFMAKYDSLLT